MMPAWIHLTHWGARGILFILLGLSVWSVKIMIERYRVFQEAERPEDFERASQLIRARDWKQLSEWSKKNTHSPLAGMLRAGLDAGNATPEQLERAVRSFLVLERAQLESGLTPLATLGSNAPFIGLLGTVLGIIEAFGALSGGQQSAGSAVMAGISEALIATAIGLFVAIPAVIGFNYFSKRLKTVMTRCEALRDLYLSRIGAGS